MIAPDAATPPLNPLSALTLERIRTHVEGSVDFYQNALGEVPIFYATRPFGLGNQVVVHHTVDDAPQTVSTCDVSTASGVQKYVVLNKQNLTWLLQAHGAVELYSWSPVADKLGSAAYARITLTASGTASMSAVFDAAALFRERLQEIALDAIPLCEASHGLTLWIPIAGSPTYERLAGFLLPFVHGVVATAPDRLTCALRIVDRGNRVFISVRTNHPAMGTLLPYAVAGLPELPVTVPVAWKRLADSDRELITTENFPAWFKQHGDLFAAMRDPLLTQQLPSVAPRASNAETTEFAREAGLFRAAGFAGAPVMPVPNPILTAAFAVLKDGAWHSADDITTQGKSLGFLPASETEKHLYTDLYEYVARSQGIGHTPEILQDPQTKAFRLNRPPDPWPEIAFAQPAPFLDATTIETLTRRLGETSTGTDPAAFEIAVCDAFTALGFGTRHIGGDAQPDGVADAPLGMDGYRIILECKTATAGDAVSHARPEEPAGFRDAFSAQYALVIGPAFGNDASLDEELTAHNVSLWTVEDLLTVLNAQCGPGEFRVLLAAGRAARACNLLVWERGHGRQKRLAVIAQTIVTTGWQIQATFAGKMPIANIPALTEDTLAALVDESLIGRGVATGADPAEFAAALSLLSAQDRVRKSELNASGYVIMSPPGLA